MLNWLCTWCGLTNPSGAQYLAWSGVIPALLGMTFVGSLLAHLRNHNCHTRGCFRLGHPDSSGVVLCRVHRPQAK